MSSLDALEQAEPLPPEDDLVLRMDAVSKLRGRKNAQRQNKKKAPATNGASKSIQKQRPKRKKKAETDVEM